MITYSNKCSLVRHILRERDCGLARWRINSWVSGFQASLPPALSCFSGSNSDWGAELGVGVSKALLARGSSTGVGVAPEGPEHETLGIFKPNVYWGLRLKSFELCLGFWGLYISSFLNVD